MLNSTYLKFAHEHDPLGTWCSILACLFYVVAKLMQKNNLGVIQSVILQCELQQL